MSVVKQILANQITIMEALSGILHADGAMAHPEHRNLHFELENRVTETEALGVAVERPSEAEHIRRMKAGGSRG